MDPGLDSERTTKKHVLVRGSEQVNPIEERENLDLEDVLDSHRKRIWDMLCESTPM